MVQTLLKKLGLQLVKRQRSMPDCRARAGPHLPDQQKQFFGAQTEIDEQVADGVGTSLRIREIECCVHIRKVGGNKPPRHKQTGLTSK